MMTAVERAEVHTAGTVPTVDQHQSVIVHVNVLQVDIRVY